MTDKPNKARRVRRAVTATLILFALLMLLLLLPVCGCAQTITGKVAGVSDGDTITVLDGQKRQYKVRLDGIDSPESNQDFGIPASEPGISV
jgi:endonuclease YncB( thermonuclease family)